jgi:phosphoribosylanthranilate isomerase
MTVRVKICGITRLEDAFAAIRAGADALGFNFWPGSKRHVDPEVAAEIVSELPPFLAKVGVFVNQTRAEVVRLAARTGMTAVQLHGDESPQFCSGFPLPVVKALRVTSASALAAMDQYTVSGFLLDSPGRGFGGSGRTFDWDLLRESASDCPVILAGGLTPDNVARAIERVAPYGVDVASGVETKPGVKDALLMARFVAAARAAGPSAEAGDD